MKIIKRLLLICIAGLLMTCITVYALGYRGQREFDVGSTLPEPSQVVAHAKQLSGTPYDPLMGKFGNIGADLGFIVCSDVPNIAYGLAGFSWKHALAEDFFRHPKAYHPLNGNNPNNPYFHRRARNLYTWFSQQGKLMPASYIPAIGDLVFYKKQGQKYISHVALVINTTDNGYRLLESAPKTLFAQEVNDTSPIERGWVFSGYGKVY